MKQHFEVWLTDMASALTNFAQEYRSNALAEDFEGWEHTQEYFDNAFKGHLWERRGL